jgi:hypothetical protein
VVDTVELDFLAFFFGVKLMLLFRWSCPKHRGIFGERFGLSFRWSLLIPSKRYRYVSRCRAVPCQLKCQFNRPRAATMPQHQLKPGKSLKLNVAAPPVSLSGVWARRELAIGIWWSWVIIHCNPVQNNPMGKDYVSRYEVCFTICLCISPDLDGNRGTTKMCPERPTKSSWEPGSF